MIYIANIMFDMYSYTHYLRPADAQLAKNVWDLIQQNNDPTNAQFHFTVRCSGGGAECPKGRYVLISLFPLHPCPSQYNHPIQHFFPPLSLSLLLHSTTPSHSSCPAISSSPSHYFYTLPSHPSSIFFFPSISILLPSHTNLTRQ